MALKVCNLLFVLLIISCNIHYSSSFNIVSKKALKIDFCDLELYKDTLIQVDCVYLKMDEYLEAISTIKCLNFNSVYLNFDSCSRAKISFYKTKTSNPFYPNEIALLSVIGKYRTEQKGFGHLGLLDSKINVIAYKSRY